MNAIYTIRHLANSVSDLYPQDRARVRSFFRSIRHAHRPKTAEPVPVPAPALAMAADSSVAEQKEAPEPALQG